MREILFRGKRFDNGEWETGSLLVERMNTSDQQEMIADKMTGYPTLVLPETIGQYTGLTDKNGVRIFEGDVIRGRSVYIGGHSTSNRALVIYKAGMFLLSFGESEEECTAAQDVEFLGAWHGSVEIIGNIHDNPELLEADKNE